MLSGKTALITGGGRGIGKAAALLLAENGARVIVCSRNGKELAETVAEAGENAQKIVCDVGNENEVKRMFSVIGGNRGGLDILVNAAAVFAGAAMEETSVEEFRRIQDINCTGTFIVCREACGLMKNNGGAIVNISSLAGIRGLTKFPGFGAYTVSKSGVAGLTEALAAEWKEYGIRVNAVAPGAVDTAMLQQAAPDLYPRLTPRQVAETILFLCGPNSSAVNGAVIELFSHLQK